MSSERDFNIECTENNKLELWVRNDEFIFQILIPIIKYKTCHQESEIKVSTIKPK